MLGCVKNINWIYVILRTECDFDPNVQEPTGIGTGQELCSLFDSDYIQGVLVGIANILRGGSMDYSE